MGTSSQSPTCSASQASAGTDGVTSIRWGWGGAKRSRRRAVGRRVEFFDNGWQACLHPGDTRSQRHPGNPSGGQRGAARRGGKDDEWIDKCMLAMFSFGLALFCRCQLAHASRGFTSSSKRESLPPPAMEKRKSTCSAGGLPSARSKTAPIDPAETRRGYLCGNLPVLSIHCDTHTHICKHTHVDRCCFHMPGLYPSYTRRHRVDKCHSQQR